MPTAQDRVCQLLRKSAVCCLSFDGVIGKYLGNLPISFSMTNRNYIYSAILMCSSLLHPSSPIIFSPFKSPSINMESLPPELLVSVGEYLKTEHPQSLISFALTSKRCYAAAATVLFRNIRITVKHSDLLEFDVKDCLRTLKRSGCLNRVRRLTVRGKMRESMPDSRPVAIENDRGDLISYSTEDPFDEDWIREPLRFMPKSSDLHWAPLANFIKQLPRLGTVDFDCDDHIPDCVLRTMDFHHNAHIKLRLTCDSSLQLDSQTRGVLTSPLLECLTVHQNRRPESDSIPAGSFLGTIPPNMKEVRILSIGGFQRSTHGQREQEHPTARGALQTIRVAGVSHESGLDLLQSWSVSTDFSVLQVLDLRCGVGIEALRWMTSAVHFAALTDLYIEKELYMSGDPARRPNAVAFLLSLPPLQGLNICGTPSLKRMAEILSRHGRSLRRLHFRSQSGAPTRYHSLREIEMIRDLCPELQRLTLSMRRTRGNGTELAIYKALGTLPRLTSLDLILDTSLYSGILSENEHTYGGTFTEEDEIFLGVSPFLSGAFNSPNAQICANLSNSAVDATLAKAIFRVIVSSTSSTSPPLGMLKIRATRAVQIGLMSSKGGIETVMKEILRSWIVTPSPRDDEVGVLIAADMASAQSARRSEEPPYLRGDVEHIFHRVWPSKRTGDWRDDYESLPLVEDLDEELQSVLSRARASS